MTSRTGKSTALSQRTYPVWEETISLTGQYTEIYFPSKGVRYIAINDNVDTINGESELAPFLNILNEMHARQTSKKVKAAMHTRFANGAHYGAYAPLGYVKDPDKKVIF